MRQRIELGGGIDLRQQEWIEPAEPDRPWDRKVGHRLSMALRGYALGHESLERLVADKPLGRVHRAAFAVLAMESEAASPRPRSFT
ncbi:hypothetical protein [Arthrobacter wenxiniae]|uniref:Polynucleotide kinase-phosphatase ligase domain-containing protein n=1 Tax=Arthrobacter wenxiniae TaxID=2713570 RepID=A0A7Y7M109_9MICC|nr:hypothetical protein [Arthrobacter wenxiniae]NVM96579.1 hypothetical protein [Arthrobacter wenxiniae]